MPGNHLQAVLECGCCGSCNGCCWPVDYSVPEYPNGVLENINWEITATGCPNIDGLSGIFTPVDPNAIHPNGACGKCACYINVTGPVLIYGEFYQEQESPIPGCYESPCAIELCFMLSCDQNEPIAEGSNDACCSRLRLLISNNTAQLSGAPNANTGTCENSIEDPTCNPNFVELGPSSCECLDDNAGVVATFDLSVLALTCAGTVVGGYCDGKPDCCSLFNCNLEGGVLVVG